MFLDEENTDAAREQVQGKREDICVPKPMSRVYIIILNWNGWRDTIECLESVLRLDYPDYRVVVCDNASSDGSLQHIRRWANGELEPTTTNPLLASLVTPPLAKPIPFTEICSSEPGIAEGLPMRLILIQTGANLGFAGGNNVGLRYALQQGDCDFAWLLNNDTVVKPDSLSHLVVRMQERLDVGICGSTLLYYHNPNLVQAYGGSVYNKWFARGGHIGKLTDASHLPEAQQIEHKLAYIVGASMLVRKSFLEQIGLLNEQYFLYFEELDWAARAQGKFCLAYCPNSIVYHKEGNSIGSFRVTEHQSTLAEYYATRNRVLVTRTHYPEALPFVIGAVFMSGLHRLIKGRWGNYHALVRGAIHGFRVTHPGGQQT